MTAKPIKQKKLEVAGVKLQKKHTIFYPPKEEIIITGEDIEKIRESRNRE